MTLQEVIDNESVGCAACYESFPAQLESLLEGLHDALAHRGKSIGAADDASTRIRADLRGKRSLLKSALQVENYEQAAALRDDVRPRVAEAAYRSRYQHADEGSLDPERGGAASG